MQIAKNILGGAFNTNNEFRRLCVERKVDNYVLVYHENTHVFLIIQLKKYRIRNSVSQVGILVWCFLIGKWENELKR